MCFNETFVREAGYTLENFPNIVLGEGIPQFFHYDDSAHLQNWQNFLDSAFVADYQELPEITTDLLMKSGYRKKVQAQSFVMKEYQDDDIIIGFFTIIKMKSIPQGSYKKVEYSEEFFSQLEERDKEKEYMLNTYYNDDYKGLFSNRDKVC